VRRGEAQNRLDAKYFALRETVTSARYPLRALGSLVSREPDYGSVARAVPRTQSHQPRYIRITDFGEDGIEPGHEYVTADRIEPDCVLSAGDLLFARSGATVGKTYLHEDMSVPAIFGGYCIRFRLDPERALPQFVYLFTKTSMCERWIAAIQRPSGQPNINKEEFKALLLPLPPVTQQQKLVAAVNLARANRTRKLAQAEELLHGIDEFLLDEIGVHPQAADGSRVCYAIRLHESDSSRLDARFYAPQIRRLEVAIREAAGVVPLESLLSARPVNGVDARGFSDSGIRYLRVQNVRPYRLSFDGITRVPAREKTKAVITRGDVLLTRKGTFGVAAVVPEDAEDCMISSEVMLLRLAADSGCSPEYLTAWLNSSVAGEIFGRHSAGGIMGHLTQRVVCAFPVPVPSPEKQRRIALGLSSRLDAASRLQAEADAEWEAAKAQLEHHLLEPTGEA